MQNTSSLDELMDRWEAHLKALGSGEPSVMPFLDLAAYDMRNAAVNIDCPYCRAHMLLEAGEISRVLARVREEGNRVHSHGAREKLRSLSTSFKIVVDVLLGGLRRAGVL